VSDLKKRLDGYRQLVDISRDLASTLELDTLLERITHAAAGITEAKAASILLYDDAAQQLHFQVATNLEQPLMRGLVVPLEGSIAGWIISNRLPVRIADAHNDPRHFSDIEQATRFTTESLLGVPLITQDKVIGVLEALNKTEGDFTETDEDFLTALGAQAAVAIQNTRLFQQSDLVSEFVHELRTPLAAIATSTYLLMRPEMSEEQRQQMLSNIHSETQRLNTLASSFLDLARLESGRVQFKTSQFDIRQVFVESVAVMQAKADEARIRVEIEVPQGFPPVEGDREKIKQVFINLVSNAVKYNRQGGSICLAGAQEAGVIVLTVRDTGIGIPADSLPHLFEKFYRVRSAEGTAVGTGLGLSICRKIVQGHGGRIEVQSVLGEGTCFSVCLPRKAAARTTCD